MALKNKYTTMPGRFNYKVCKWCGTKANVKVVYAICKGLYKNNVLIHPWGLCVSCLGNDLVIALDINYKGDESFIANTIDKDIKELG